jgi:hypothetical protein
MDKAGPEVARRIDLGTERRVFNGLFWDVSASGGRDSQALGRQSPAPVRHCVSAVQNFQRSIRRHCGVQLPRHGRRFHNRIIPPVRGRNSLRHLRRTPRTGLILIYRSTSLQHWINLRTAVALVA